MPLLVFVNKKYLTTAMSAAERVDKLGHYCFSTHYEQRTQDCCTVIVSMKVLNSYM